MSNTQETGGCDALPDPALLWPATMHIDDSGQVVLVEKGLIICRESIGQLDSSELVAGALIESHKAGRYTLDEVALGLAEKTQVNDAERWLETILNAVNLGELALKSPEDNLPYKPEKIREWSDQLSAIDIDRWLDSHPEYGITFRFHREWMQPTETQPAEPDPSTLRKSVKLQEQAFTRGFEVTQLERRLAMEKMSYSDERQMKSDIREMRAELERLVNCPPADLSGPPQTEPDPRSSAEPVNPANSGYVEARQHAAPHVPSIENSRNAETAPIERRKRKALIRELKIAWPTIENDLRHGDTNGLTGAAKLSEHGFWDKKAALKWAEERGKLNETGGGEEKPSGPDSF